MKIVIITGQTASGKTKLALEYARKFNGELINCDSRQIYKRLDIVTGKELKNKIYLNDIVYPNQYFSSFDYQQKAIKVIKKILGEGKTPIIVGGTYFYLSHLLYGVETEEIPPNFKLRKKLASKSINELQNIFNTIGVQSFNRLNNSEKNNPQRLIRKIEIAKFYSSSERSESRSTKDSSQQARTIKLDEKLGIKNLRIVFIGLKFKDKGKLKQAITNRVEERLKNGAIDEVKKLLKMGYKESDPGLKTIGYQQIIQYLKGTLTQEQAINEWITKEIQYAKRQLTFMKKDKNISWKEI